MMQYWNLVRKDRPIPDIIQFNNKPIEDLWGNCFTVAISRDTETKYKYEHMGEKIATAYGRDMTGQTVDPKMRQFPGAVMCKKLEEVVAQGKPMEDEGNIVTQTGGVIKYRACFLPFGSDKKGVTHIIAGLSFRVF